MQTTKINLKKENYLYRLNIKHEELIKPFNFFNVKKVRSGQMKETTTTTLRPNKDTYITKLRLFQDTDGIFKEEFQIELLINEETYQAFYYVDEEDFVYLTKYEYLDLIQIFQKMDYETETNLIDLRIIGVDFLSGILSTAYYNSDIFDLNIEVEDFKKSYESIRENTVNKVVRYEDIAAQGLLDGRKVKVYDREGFKEHFVTLHMLQKGLETLKEKYPKEYSNIISDKYNSVDIDMFIQCALFREVIYGRNDYLR